MDETSNPWTILGEKEVYDNAWIEVKEFNVLNPSGGPGIYGKVHFKNLAVGVLPIDADGFTYLVGQYRFTLGEYSWEMPEGGCPLGTPPLEAAQRELKEETGLEAGKWTLLQEMHLSNSVSDERALLYLARNLKAGQAIPEETEKLQVRKLPFREMYQWVCDGRITDAMTVAATLRVMLMINHGEITL